MIITINVMKFLWGLIFPYKGIDGTIIYRKKGKYIQGQEIHAKKCLELNPQPFPTQSYVGKGNAPFTRQTQELHRLISETPCKKLMLTNHQSRWYPIIIKLFLTFVFYPSSIVFQLSYQKSQWASSTALNRPISRNRLHIVFRDYQN